MAQRKLNIMSLWIPKETPYRKWILLFSLLLAVFSNRNGLSTNVLSRVSLLLALSEKHSFEISPWENITIDWAKTPDGKYYSNKAPGPSFIAAPLFMLLYKPLNRWLIHPITDARKQKVAWNNMMSFIMWVLCLVFQVFPFAWVVSRLALLMKCQSIPNEGIFFFLIASMFGNTGDFYMNNFYGHGYAMVFSLATLYFTLKMSWVYVGLALGLGVLGDYSSALLIPLVGIWILFRERSNFFKVGTSILKGIIIPFTLFAFYHWKCFGGFATLPQKFQNPLFVDSKKTFENFGVISWLPDFRVVLELLFGPTRGILFTQPYILILVVLTFIQFFKSLERKNFAVDNDSIGIISALFFLGLLWMNAGFNGWHGGSAPGPRYLVSAFPCIALTGALNWNEWGAVPKKLLWITLVFSAVFFSLVLAAGQAPPESQSLLGFYSKLWVDCSDTPQFWYRWAAMGIGLATISWIQVKSTRHKV